MLSACKAIVSVSPRNRLIIRIFIFSYYFIFPGEDHPRAAQRLRVSFRAANDADLRPSQISRPLFPLLQALLLFLSLSGWCVALQPHKPSMLTPLM
jgi:hypothetical protein